MVEIQDPRLTFEITIGSENGFNLYRILDTLGRSSIALQENFAARMFALQLPTFNEKFTWNKSRVIKAFQRISYPDYLRSSSIPSRDDFFKIIFFIFLPYVWRIRSLE